MRHAILSSLVICSLAFAAEKAKTGVAAGKTVKISGGEDENSEESSGDENEEEPQGGPPEGSLKAAPSEKTGPGTQHTVEKGDTLWDLSQRYLGSPWYWPKVWSYNPEIANPHWIYPGNVVRFQGTGEEAPTQVELGTAPDVSPAEQLDEDTVQVAGKLAFVPKGTMLYRSTGFVTAKDIEESGFISGSFEQHENLSENESIYLRFKNKGTAKIGDKFVIFRPGEALDHPKTGARVGYLTELRGVARVTRTDGPMVTAMIIDSFDPIYRGDLVAPFSESLAKRVAVKPNDKKLDGTIVAQLGIGTIITVIIDQGSDQGVQPGNTFTVVRQHDGDDSRVVNYPDYRDEDYPVEDVGACIAWEVKTSTTSCLVMSAMREIVVGDLVQMRPTASSAPARTSMR